MSNDRFRDRLALDFASKDIRTKKELGIALRKRSYHKRKYKGKTYDISPTQEQINSAWEYLKFGYTYPESRRKQPIIRNKHEYSLRIKGKKKRQIRDRRTGRIIRWE